MSARRLVILSVVVLLLFGFILLIERRMPSTEERQRLGQLHWDLPEDRIDEFLLEQSGGQIRLKKEGETWRILLPEPYPTDPMAISDLTAQLGDLKSAEGEAAGAKPEDYGLRPAAAKATVFWTPEKGGARQQRTLELGIEIPGTDVIAARVEAAGGVVFVPASVGAAVRKGLDDLKSREVFGGSAFDVSRLDIERGRARVVLAKKAGSWWMEQPVADLASADTVDELVGELTGLRVQEFVSGPERADLSALGLSPPAYRVTLTDAKGKAAAVELGSTRAEGSGVYGRRESQVFTVEGSITEDLSREAIALRSPQLVRFDRADVSAVEGSFGTDKFALGQKDGGWTVGGRPLLASAADDVLTAILALTSRAFLDEETAKGAGKLPGAGRVTVALTNGERWDVALHPKGRGIAAVVGRRPGAFELPGDAASRLEESFRKATAAPAPTPAATPAKKPSPRPRAP